MDETKILAGFFMLVLVTGLIWQVIATGGGLAMANLCLCIFILVLGWIDNKQKH